MPGLLRFADRVTAVVQPGSLPVYGAVVLTTVLLLPGIAVARGVRLPADLVLAESPLQVAVGAIVVGAALGAALVRRRMSAVLLLGAVGYGVAVLFVLQGAPDLALTQMLVETLSLAVFVLVLRRLPVDFGHHPWRLGQGLRVAISVGVGLFVGGALLMSSAARTDGTAAAEFLARAKPEGGGSNVVNVILTDFRALDTFGEITVLLVAAIGISLLVRTPTPRDDEEERPMTTPSATPRRSLILDTVLDMVTRTALLFSAFLLFAGHNAPGGGFVGGLVAAHGAGAALRRGWCRRGRRGRRRARAHPARLRPAAGRADGRRRAGSPAGRSWPAPRWRPTCRSSGR